MVHTCCVFKCYNRATKDTTITFHSFPSKNNKERFDAWVRAVNRQTETGRLWMPSVHNKVCSEHFLETDFKPHTNIRTLKEHAVPSVFPHHPVRLLKTGDTPRREPKKRSNAVNDTEVCENAARRVALDHSYCFITHEQQIQKLKDRIQTLERSLEECRAENKALKQRLKRRDMKCDNLINQLREEKVISEEKAALLDYNFDKATLTLIQNELSAKKTSCNKHQYSESVKSFAVTVHFYSPQAYEYLRSFLHLPNSSTIRRWAASLNCEPGFLSDVINTLGDKLSIDEGMRDICVMFDALSIKKGMCLR
ncbi:THAP domain-containing protein 1 [Elysia marginata]|uniref:THAP domain-containing protein 1 n=1 Tax=Elysia marginata TaxID=1093978 RepID=A0AAV4GYY9_9GAST|nr:THAP domain-containing protein 1 [Elysia marginata]